MTATLLIGDVLARLRGMPDSSVDCVVTSPPYWGLRDYGIAGQIGLEPTLGEHLAVLVGVFREVRRVLKVSGTCFVNYGDCYATTPNGRAAAEVENDDRTFRDKPFSTIGPIYQPAHSANPRRDFISGDRQRQREGVGRVVAGGYLKPKDLCMVPNRLAIALQDDGWWVRSEIIWNKTNPKPESIADRPAAVHEKIWLLSKSETYFFNAEALKEPVTGGAKPRRKDGQCRPAKGDGAGGKRAGTWIETYVPDLRNGRNVWTFNIEGCREAHFATFPRELARRCIAAGTPLSTCAACGAIAGCGALCAVFGRIPGVVLDPFGGAGTVGLVAEGFGVDSVLIELNPDYAAIARRRIDAAAADVHARAAQDVATAFAEPAPMRRGPNLKWTAAKTQAFIALWQAGAKIAAIGAKLDFSKASLLAKRAELGLPLRRDPSAPRADSISLWLTDAERDQVERQARSRMLGLADYLRMLVRRDADPLGEIHLVHEALQQLEQAA